MPNWVYNHVSITGSKKALDKFVEVAGKENGINRPDENGELRIFSYSAFLMPPRKHLKDYHETNGWKDGKRLGDTEWNWYNWNLRNWGVKWDARSPELERTSDKTLSIAWESPWGIPTPALEAMAQKFPTLEFDGRSEEEQGWGANWYAMDGEFSITAEWDIPSSHADFANPEGYNNESSCTCYTYYSDEPEEWYDDCPGKAEAIKEQQEKQLEGAN